jgi:membrane-associated phospholipid phosphatase
MVQGLWTTEKIALAYFVYLAVACWLRALPVGRRVFVTTVALAMIVVIRGVAGADIQVLREWAPFGYIGVGYYLSGSLFVAPSLAMEGWLMEWDRRLLGDPTKRFAKWPRPLIAFLELTYVGCFLVLVVGYGILAATGRRSMADMYWTLVTGAEFGSFAPLAFIQTRPPWAIEKKPVLADRAVHEFAAHVTERFTIRVNTFPSGHVAVSLAVALAVGMAMPLAGMVLLALAGAIALATVVGRYHYVVDVIAGAALTLALWAVLSWIRA